MMVHEMADEFGLKSFTGACPFFEEPTIGLLSSKVHRPLRFGV